MVAIDSTISTKFSKYSCTMVLHVHVVRTLKYSTVQYSTARIEIHAAGRHHAKARIHVRAARGSWRTSDPRGAVRGELRMDRFQRILT